VHKGLKGKNIDNCDGWNDGLQNHIIKLVCDIRSTTVADAKYRLLDLESLPL